MNQWLALNSTVTRQKIDEYDRDIGKWKYPFANVDIVREEPKWLMSELPTGYYYVWEEPYYVGDNQWEIFIGITDDPGNVHDIYTSGPEDATELSFTYDDGDVQFPFTGTL